VPFTAYHCMLKLTVKHDHHKEEKSDVVYAFALVAIH
jgi:hypothetical protein